MAEHSPEPPFPWQLPGRMLHCFEELSSTMDKARDLALGGCPPMTVVVAKTQTKGRGRLDRVWDSQRGGLYFTLILRPQVPPEECFRFNFLASVSLAKMLRRRYGIEAAIKWPNDILVGTLKLAGMLSEMHAAEGKVHFISIGIGINVDNIVTASPHAVSLSLLLEKPAPRLPLLAEFLDEFSAGEAKLDTAQILSEWKALAVPFNRQVTVVTTREEFRGIAEDIDSEGALVLKLPDGTRKRILYGDCFF